MAEFSFELDLPPGINSDDTTFAAAGRWADGSNIRFPNGKPEALGRITRILDGGLGVAPDARTMFAYTIGEIPSPMVVIGSTTTLIAGGGTSLLDITPASLPPCDYWAFASWGDILLAAPKGGKLYASSIEVAGAPAAMSHMLVTAERQVLALGCNEEISGVFNPMCIRGSNLEDYTDWTTTATNNAFEHVLEGEGKIVAGRLIGGYVAVWTSDALYIGQFLGDPAQTYRFDRVDSGCGLVGPGAVQVLGGFAYWMTPDHHFLRWAPGGLVEPIACPIGRELRANMVLTLRRDQRTIAAANSLYGEIWWFYPDVRDLATGGYRYVALQTRDGTWFRGKLDRRAAFEGGFLIYPGFSGGTYRSWRPFVSVDGDGKVWSHDVEDAGAGITDQVSWFIQSADQYVESGRRRTLIRGIVPDFEQQSGDVFLILSLRDRPQSPPVTKGPYTLAIGATKKDFRASGMLMSVKLASSAGGSQTQWRMGKPVFDCVTMGGR